MNKKRKETKPFISLSAVVGLLAILIVAGGAVWHAYLKNCQLEVARDIDRAKQRIIVAEESMKVQQMQIDRKLNRHMLRADLASRGSELVSIKSEDVEIVTPIGGEADTVAATAL